MAMRQALQRGLALPEEFREAASRRNKRTAAIIVRILVGTEGLSRGALGSR
jgi:hypothetical protein